jgi:hypothetical protein
VQREEPLKLSDVSALLVVVHIYKKARACEDLKHGVPPGFFYSTQREIILAKNIVVQNAIHYCAYETVFPYIMLPVR